jgi:hypothetical protein
MQGYGDRNVRPRTSGGGGAPAGAAVAAGRYGHPHAGMPVGPPRQQGFNPAAQQNAAVGFNPAVAQRGGAGYGGPGYGESVVCGVARMEARFESAAVWRMR